jgi:hypothetical protein
MAYKGQLVDAGAHALFISPLPALHVLPIPGENTQTTCCRLGWRTDGAAYAVVCCQATTALQITGYRLYRDLVQLKGSPKQTWHGWSRSAFRGWGKYLKYGVPAAMVRSAASCLCATSHPCADPSGRKMGVDMDIGHDLKPQYAATRHCKSPFPSIA